MKMDRLILTAFSPAFPGTVDLVLRDLEPGLVAIVGENGAGKTTLLEAPSGAVYRQMPSSEGEDPVSYATSRESKLLLEYSTADAAFRSTLNLDGPKRATDALLEQQLPNGPWSPLNDGKRSTYDAAIVTRFPSFDLFINSSFAAQGRGDEFTRRKPSQRKDLFAEFLGQQHYGVMAKSASAAAELCADATLRLEAQIDVLERDTASTVEHELASLAQALETSGGDADVRKRQLTTTLADLEAQVAAAGDDVAAYSAATERVRRLETDLATARADHARLTAERERAILDYAAEMSRIVTKRDTTVTDAANRIAGNQKILDMVSDIRTAVAAIGTADAILAEARAELVTVQERRNATAKELRLNERELAILRQLEQDRDRAVSDSAILTTVPCGGAGDFAGCQFLVNATAAQAKLADFEQRLLPKATIADRIAELTTTGDRHAAAAGVLETRIAEAEASKRTHQKTADYAAPLAAAEARIAELTTAQDSARTDADEQLGAAKQREMAIVNDRDARLKTVGQSVTQLETDLASATTHLEQLAAGNQAAAHLQGQLLGARAEWDRVISTLATVESRGADLDRRRADLEAKRTRLVIIRARKAAIDQELVEWLDLAKAFAKGGLPDLEIDAAGPTISATTNAILQECFGPRFTVELVTQVENAAGGMKDEFTVRVIDNEQSGAEWRDIKKFSGGQKTILQEALMCAIALYVNERSPMPIRTLWRDETGAALDGENALRYVQMLRKVRELGGFFHVYFITHNAEAAQQADAQIQVGGGTARIVLPPFEVPEAA